MVEFKIGDLFTFDLLIGVVIVFYVVRIFRVEDILGRSPKLVNIVLAVLDVYYGSHLILFIPA